MSLISTSPSPYVCYKRKHWTGWDRSAGLWTCRWAARPLAGQDSVSQALSLPLRLGLRPPQVWASLCSARSRVSTPRADFCPFQCHPSPAGQPLLSAPATASLVGPWGSLGECAFCRTARDAHAQPMSATVAGQDPSGSCSIGGGERILESWRSAWRWLRAAGRGLGAWGGFVLRAPCLLLRGGAPLTPSQGRTPPAPARRRLGSAQPAGWASFPLARKRPW